MVVDGYKFKGAVGLAGDTVKTGLKIGGGVVNRENDAD